MEQTPEVVIIFAAVQFIIRASFLVLLVIGLFKAVQSLDMILENFIFSMHRVRMLVQLELDLMLSLYWQLELWFS